MPVQERIVLPMAARLAITLIAGAALSAALYLLTLWLAGSPLLERPATCLPEGCFCEAASGRVPEQFAASYSAIAFVLFGIWALLPSREPELGTPERPLRPLFGLVFVFIGASTFVYHATLSFFGQFFDIFSMYTFGILLALGALYRAGRLSARASIALFLVLNAIFAVVQYEYPGARRVLFVVLLLPGIILEMTPWITGHSARSPRVRYVYLGVATMLVAYVIWTLDQTEAACHPHSPLQGHAVWHVLSAVAAFLILQHHRLTPHHGRPQLA